MRAYKRVSTYVACIISRTFQISIFYSFPRKIQNSDSVILIPQFFKRDLKMEEFSSTKDDFTDF